MKTGNSGTVCESEVGVVTQTGSEEGGTIMLLLLLARGIKHGAVAAGEPGNFGKGGSIEGSDGNGDGDDTTIPITPVAGDDDEEGNGAEEIEDCKGDSC